MGMKYSVPKFWIVNGNEKNVFPIFGIGNGNGKQCSQPKFGKNWLKSLGEKLGTGIPAHAWAAFLKDNFPNQVLLCNTHIVLGWLGLKSLLFLQKSCLYDETIIYIGRYCYIMMNYSQNDLMLT